MDTDRFLKDAPAARRVRIGARAVIGRGLHRLTEVADLARAGTYAPREDGLAGGRQGAAELEVSGVVLARGKVVRKGGQLFFKVTELGKAREGGDR